MDLDGICHVDWQKTLDDGTFLYLFGTQHTQFESGLAVFLFLVSQLLSFFKPAWDTFQNWLALVRHPRLRFAASTNIFCELPSGLHVAFLG